MTQIVGKGTGRIVRKEFFVSIRFGVGNALLGKIQQQCHIIGSDCQTCQDSDTEFKSAQVVVRYDSIQLGHVVTELVNKRLPFLLGEWLHKGCHIQLPLDGDDRLAFCQLVIIVHVEVVIPLNFFQLQMEGSKFLFFLPFQCT